MFPARLNDRKQYNEDNTDGISINKLADKSKETKFGANEIHAGADNVCNEQSDRHKYFRHCHFSSGRECTFDVEEENEEFDTTLLERYIPARVGRVEELLRELDGRGDEERFPRYSWISASEPIREGCCGGLICGSLGDVFEGKRASPMYEGEWTCRELRWRRRSASSRTRSMISSEGSLILPRFTIRERRVSEMICQP